MSFVKHWRIGLLGAAVSLLAIYFIASQIDLDLLWDALTEARFIYVLPCILLLLIGLLVRACRWRLLLSNGLPFWRTFHIMNVAYLVNGVLPLRMGEVARAYLATRADPPVPVLKSASTILVERLLDLLAVMMLIVIALVAGSVPEELRAGGLLMGSVGFSGFLFLMFLSRQRDLAQRLLEIATGRLPFLDFARLSRWLDHFLDGLLPLAQGRTLLLALFWTAVSWMFSVTAGYILMYTFYEQASWAATCLYIAAAALSIAVPGTLGSLGVYEGSIVLALSALGYGESQTVAVAFAVTVHLVNLLVHAGTGVIGFVEEGVSLQQLRRGVREVSDAARMNEIGEKV